ncbi:MAG: hypothetical protein A2370_01885 [Candidatus Vogelbacteria bacterium RIFOXYB1_FULL_42_16]|nr:MAG: hypothetical protein A2370_01885 [Candidatus Vogelbacteria bacterium RIFOXYB1_FULL_42_16]
MTLRIQKSKHKEPWTIEELSAGLEKFFSDNGHYPTAPEVDRYQYLPSARSIERRFGGMIQLRQTLKLGGQIDFRSGQHSADRAHLISERGHSTEKIVYDFLVERFGKEFVHREYFFVDDKRTRADFFVYDKNGGFCVDVFYPGSKRNLQGCLNSKLDKYASEYMRQYPVIFLQMNKEITQGILDILVKNKRKILGNGQHLMAWESFTKFCHGRKRLSLGK